MPKNIARNYQCLMIEAGGRNYFTHESNLPQLLEFCKSFDMSMSVVKVEEAPILDIAELPKAICDAKKTSKAEYNLIRKVVPFDPAVCIPLVRTRSQILETAKSVREKIRERFAKGEAVNRDMLEEEFPDASITATTFMQHLRNARKELEGDGYKFERISPGCYRAITPEQQKAQAEEAMNYNFNYQTWIKHKGVAKPKPTHTVYWDNAAGGGGGFTAVTVTGTGDTPEPAVPAQQTNTPPPAAEGLPVETPPLEPVGLADPLQLLDAIGQAGKATLGGNGTGWLTPPTIVITMH